MSYRPISRALALLSLLPTLALALPTSPDVQAGGAFLDRVDKATMHITCQDKTVINWDTFSIDHHEALKFIQSADSTVLNRVTGHITGGDISRIMGTLESQGNVYILNPQGIFIGKDATINVGSLIASTLNITNADFFEACNGVKGKRGEEGLKEASVLFSGDSQAKVLNLGTIKATSGDVHVIAYEIENQGKIEAAKGQVSLNACQEAILQPASNRRVLIKTKIENTQGGDNKGKPANANLSETGIKNTGVIKALEARLGAEGSLYKLAINQSGHIEAKTFVADKGGKIFLTAEKGSIKVDGKMVAGIVTPQSLKARPNKSEKGGYIEVLADSIRLENKADINVSGRIGGGTALIGSDYQGKGMPFNSQHTYIGRGANVTASAWGNGNGGKIIFWGDESIEFLGNVTAQGGPNGGDGGFVEVSSPGTQPGAFKVGGLVSTLAPKGKTGTLLWDPDSILVSDGLQSNMTYSENDPSAGTSTYTQDSPLSVGIINDYDLATYLDVNNVIIDATSDGEGGQIFVSADIEWNLATQLTLRTSGTLGAVSVTKNLNGTDPGSSILVESNEFKVGDQSHTLSDPVEVQAGTINITLNGEQGKVEVFSGSGAGAHGKLTAHSGAVTIKEADNVTGGSVLVESKRASGGSGTGDAIIQGKSGIDIGMNFEGLTDNVGDIEVFADSTGSAGIKTTDAGDIKLYCHGGDISVKADNDDSVGTAYIETTDGNITYSLSGTASAAPGTKSDLAANPMSQTIVEALGGGTAYIKAQGSSGGISMGKNLANPSEDVPVFIGGVNLNADTSSEAYIESVSSFVGFDASSSVSSGARLLSVDASLGGVAKIIAGTDATFVADEVAVDSGSDTGAQAFIKGTDLLTIDISSAGGGVVISDTSDAVAYLEGGHVDINGPVELTATNQGSRVYITATDGDTITLRDSPTLIAESGGEVYIGDEEGTTPGEGCGKITITEGENPIKLWAKAAGSTNRHVSIYSGTGAIEINPASGTGGGLQIINEGVNSSKASIISDSTDEIAIDIDVKGDITITMDETDISGEPKATINATLSEARIGSQEGQILVTNYRTDNVASTIALVGLGGISLSSLGDITFIDNSTSASAGALAVSSVSGNTALSSSGGSINVGASVSVATLGSRLDLTASHNIVIGDSGGQAALSTSSGDATLIAGADVVFHPSSSVLSIGGGNVVVVTDNNFPSPSGSPEAGSGNLTMGANSSLITDGQIRIYSGFDENNRANIDDSALFGFSSPAVYSALKGQLDTQDTHNYFGVWYNVTAEPGYAGPATFYYKETTPSTAGGTVNTADIVAAGLISSQTLSSYFGDTLLNFLRRNYVHNTKSFKNQYRRAKTPLRRKVMGNKEPKDARPQGSSPESSSGTFKTNTYRSKK